MTLGRKVAWIAAAQVAMILGLIGWKQVTVATGQTVVLRCAPLDPRDLLRGQYVALDYDIATVPLYDLGKPRIGETIYVPLRRTGRYSEAGPPRRERPEDETTWIAGKVTDFRTLYGSGGTPDHVVLDYGIGTYMVPRGQGPVLEAKAREQGKMLAATVMVDRFGRAVLRRVDVVARDRILPTEDVYPKPVQPGATPAKTHDSASKQPKSTGNGSDGPLPPGGSVIVPADEAVPAPSTGKPPVRPDKPPIANPAR